MDETTIRDVMRQMGSLGGKRRKEALTRERRVEIARKAGKKSGKVRRKNAKKRPT